MAIVARDQGEPTAADVRSRYPEWVPYRGSLGGICHARRIGSALDVGGDSWQDVLDEIAAAEARLAGTPRMMP